MSTKLACHSFQCRLLFVDMTGFLKFSVESLRLSPDAEALLMSKNAIL